MECDIAVDILRALVSLLHPQREIELGKLFNETTNDISESSDSDDNDGEHGNELDYSVHTSWRYIGFSIDHQCGRNFCGNAAAINAID